MSRRVSKKTEQMYNINNNDGLDLIRFPILCERTLSGLFEIRPSLKHFFFLEDNRSAMFSPLLLLFSLRRVTPC